MPDIVKFASPPVINAVSISLAVHCHAEWWGVVSIGMVTVKFTKRSDSLIFLTVETEKANFGAWNLSFDIVKWYRWEF